MVDEFKQIIATTPARTSPKIHGASWDLATRSVFDSWNTDRAKLYRRRERIPHDLGTAVDVCTMVFGNLGATSAPACCSTRDPATGKPGVYGDYISNAQGEDAVLGHRQHPVTRRLRQARP